MKYILFIVSIGAILLSCNEKSIKHDDHGHDIGHEASHKTKESHDHNTHDDHKHSNDQAKHDDHESHNDHEGHDDHDNEKKEIHLTKRQMEVIGLAFGNFTDIKINGYVRATGTLGLPPDAYSSVSPKVEGFIKNAKNYVEGSNIKKGSIIAYIENPILIEKQELYLSTSTELTYLQQEYRRQKALWEQNAGIEKNVDKLYAEVQIKKAKKLGIEEYLKYLGININDVLIGNFIQRIPIVAPISGFISFIEMHNGLYVKPEETLLEILSIKHIHLELDVFEKDIAKVKEEQSISYVVPALGDEIYLGEVHVIGKEFSEDSKAVRVHGHLEGKKPKFIKDLFITAKIWLDDREEQALPEEAVVKDGGTSVIYYTLNDKPNNHGEIEFQIAELIPGLTENGYVAVKLLNELPKEAKIVTKGAYYLYAQSKYGEKVHEH